MKATTGVSYRKALRTSFSQNASLLGLSVLIVITAFNHHGWKTIPVIPLQLCSIAVVARSIQMKSRNGRRSFYPWSLLKMFADGLVLGSLVYLFSDVSLVRAYGIGVIAMSALYLLIIFVIGSIAAARQALAERRS